MALLRSVRYLRLSCLNNANFSANTWRISNFVEKANAGPTTPKNNLRLCCRYFATENVQTSADREQKQQQRKTSSAFGRRTGNTATQTIEEQQQKLDRALYRMDIEVRKTGRISVEDVKDIINEIKIAGVASPTQSLLVIRCCGALLPDEHVKDRVALVDDVWNTLRNLHVQLDVSHYNALLKVHLENEHRFSPTDFLAEMEAKGVVPNRVTYQRLVGHYCQQGDMAGASKILDFMKEKDLPINENVFNSLIQGHTRASDFESAKAILDVMRNAKLEPSGDTYTYLIRGYAEKGDIDRARAAIKEAEGGDVQLLDRDYLDILVTLAANGHSQHADEILAKLRKSGGYNHDAINAIYQLVNAGQEDVALKLLLTMPTLLQMNGEPIPSGRFLIRQLVKAGRPIEKILQMCDNLKNLSLNAHGIIIATESALNYERIDYAETFLKAMKEQGHPIRPHFFWPLFASYRKRNDEKGIYDTLRLMTSLDSPADADTLIDYVLPSIRLSDWNIVLDKLKDLGFTLAAVVGPLVGQLVTMKNMEAAVQLLKTHPVRLTISASLVRPLAAAYQETKNLDAVLELLTRVNDSKNAGQRYDWTGSFLFAYVRVADHDLEDLERLVNGLKSRRLEISSATVDLILEHQSKNPNIDRLTELLEEICSTSLEVGGGEQLEGGSHFPHPRDMNLEELENHYVELKAKNMSVRGLLRRLIFQYCRFKNMSRAMEIKDEFDAANMLYTPAMYAQLMDLHVSHSQLPEALQYLSKLTEADPDFKIDNYKIVNLATLFVENDRVGEALKLIEKHGRAAEVATERLDNSVLLNNNVWRLLRAAANKGNVEDVNRLYDIVIKFGYVIPNNNILGPTVKSHLVRDDVEGALKQFEHCCKVHRFTPLKNELFMKLIELEDAEKLQKVVDLSTDVHGEMNTMYDLASSFIDCNRLRQARKIFETPGMRARPQRLDSICQRYLSEDKVESIESIVAITRDLFLVDRDQLYFYLLRAYVKHDDVDKALGVWTALQEENVQPSERTLAFLADFLKKHNRPVPFAEPKQVLPSMEQQPPQKTEKQQQQNKRSKLATKLDTADDGHAKRFLAAINAENADEATKLKEEIEKDGRQLSISNTSRLLELLLIKNRVKDAVNVSFECLNENQPSLPLAVRSVLRQVAASGDMATIDSFGQCLNEEQKQLMKFNNHRATALIANGRHMELLESMEASTSSPNSDNIPSGVGLIGLLDSHPELSDRVEQVVNAYAEQKIYNPLNVFWIHHFMNENYEKADDILRANSMLRERLRYMHIVKKASEAKNVDMLRRLAETVCNTRLSSKSKGVVYSYLLNVHVDMGNLDTAVATVNEVTSTRGLELGDLHLTALMRLKSALEAQGKPVPFTVPTAENKKSAVS